MKAWQIFVVGTIGAIAIFSFHAYESALVGIQSVRNASGIRLVIANRGRPALAIILPGYPDSDRSIEVIFPEHVTAKRHDNSEPEHLYLSNGGQQAEKPVWRQTLNSLEYERDLSGGIHFLARATLEDDGVLFHYEFLNRSNFAYDMIYAVTDPRLTGVSTTFVYSAPMSITRMASTY